MTEKEVEKAYKKMTESDAPDLWAKIESNLPEKEVRTEKKVRTGFFAKLGKIFSGGSTWKTSAAVCAVCIIVLGTAQGAGGMFRAGASNGTASAASKSSYGMDAYSVDGAEAYSAEGDGKEAAPADYNGMNYAAAAAGTGADADSSGGAVVLSENEASEASADEAGTAENGKETANSADTENGQSSRKLIRTFNLDAETTDFDNLVTQLQQETQNLGGYVESSYVNGNSYYTENSRYASLTLRIPKDKTDDFLGTVGKMANVTSKSENVEDVTLTYTDLKSHVEALQAEQEQLMKLMEQAKTVEDTMSIQSRLTDVFIEDIKKAGGILCNLASDEMKSLFDWKRVEKEVHVITPEFQVWKNGKLASIVIYIKMSRGEMTRFILKNRIENPEDLKSFSWEGFEFNESLSNEKKFVFTNGKEI